MRIRNTPEFNGFSGMNNGRSDYEGFYDVSSSYRYWGSHTHDFYEFYIHYAGGSQMACNDQVFQLQPCQLFIFPPFCVHGLICKSELKNYERAYLYCTTDTLQRASCGQIDLDYTLRTALSEKGYAFLLGAADAEMCRSCIQTVSVNQYLRTPEAEFEDYAVILQFLNCVLRTVREEDADAQPVPAPNRMQQVITYINEHYRETIHLQDICDHFNLSQSALSHEFTRYTNRGVYDYILFRRIVWARQMILSGAPLGEIAERSGFSDYSNFLRIFTKLMGMSPREYREKMTGETKLPAAW